MNKPLTYDLRGVSASKDEVHNAIKHLDKGLFPNAFCKIIPDIGAGNPEFCNIMHADTAGTKTSLAYIYWKETGDLSVWKGIVEDAIVMNLDDMACVGCVDGIVLSSTIGRNKLCIPGDVISTLISHTAAYIDKLNALGIGITLAGGETADVGDIVRTIDVGYTAFARMPRKSVRSVDIQENDWIVGFSSSGKASYEDNYNGGMGSNGLTSARHDVFSHEYVAKYPESFNPMVDDDVVYCGSKKLTDPVDIAGETMTVGKLVLSPTRTYMPLIREILSFSTEHLHGLIHCTGGGQTKVSKFMDKTMCVRKNNLFPIPPLFQIIQEESGIPLAEMYQVFNMGHRLEAYVSSRDVADELISMADSFGIEAQVIGRTQASTEPVILLEKEGQTILEYRY